MIDKLVIEFEGKRRDDDPAPGTYRLTIIRDDGPPETLERLSWTRLVHLIADGMYPLRWHMRALLHQLRLPD